MKKLSNQTGAVVLELMLLLAVLGIAAFVLLRANSVKQEATAPAKSPAVSTTTAQGDEDLQKEDQEITKDNLDVPTADEAQLDSELATF